MSVLNHILFRTGPAILAALLLAFGGCGFYDTGETLTEEQERAFQRGKQLLREGRQDDALRSFLRVIDRRPRDAPESHFEAADIYLTHLEEPVEAIYHFRRYLEQKPNSPQADLVRGQINRAMKEFARTLPAQPLQHTLERLDLLASIEELENENQQLKREVAGLREEREALHAAVRDAEQRAEAAARQIEDSRREQTRQREETPRSQTATASATPTAETERSARTPSRSRTYTVEPGDNLYRISARVYGTGNRWQEIYEANRDVLPNANSVRAGMTLEIPLD